MKKTLLLYTILAASQIFANDPCQMQLPEKLRSTYETIKQENSFDEIRYLGDFPYVKEMDPLFHCLTTQKEFHQYLKGGINNQRKLFSTDQIRILHEQIDSFCKYHRVTVMLSSYINKVSEIKARCLLDNIFSGIKGDIVNNNDINDAIEFKIPKITHGCWVTSSVTPYEVPENILSRRIEFLKKRDQKDKTWKHYLWCLDSTKIPKTILTLKNAIPNIEIHEVKEIEESFKGKKIFDLLTDCRYFAFASNILRINVVYHFGGFYSDLGIGINFDLENTMKNFDHILSINDQNFAETVFGALPKSPVFGNSIKFLENFNKHPVDFLKECDATNESWNGCHFLGGWVYAASLPTTPMTAIAFPLRYGNFIDWNTHMNSWTGLHSSTRMTHKYSTEFILKAFEDQVQESNTIQDDSVVAMQLYVQELNAHKTTVSLFPKTIFPNISLVDTFFNKVDCSTSKNLVLGTCTGYSDPKQIEVFVKSCRLFMPEVDLVLATDIQSYLGDEKTTGVSTFFKQYAVKPLFFESRHFIATHVANSRYFKYLEYLLENPNYNKVFLSDVRDAAFQGDVFQTTPAQFLYFFSEGFPIEQDQTWNSSWIKKNYDSKIYDFVKNKNVLCSGTTLGDSKSVTKYCMKLSQQRSLNKFIEIAQDPSYGPKPDEQGPHNVMAYADNTIGIEIKENGDIVGTISGLALQSLKVEVKENKVWVNNKQPKVVHQYDRLPSLVNLFKVLYS